MRKLPNSLASLAIVLVTLCCGCAIVDWLKPIIPPIVPPVTPPVTPTNEPPAPPPGTTVPISSLTSTAGWQPTVSAIYTGHVFKVTGLSAIIAETRLCAGDGRMIGSDLFWNKVYRMSSSQSNPAGELTCNADNVAMGVPVLAWWVLLDSAARQIVFRVGADGVGVRQ
jgi:hypothetical protein